MKAIPFEIAGHGAFDFLFVIQLHLIYGKSTNQLHKGKTHSRQAVFTIEITRACSWSEIAAAVPVACEVAN